MQKVMGPDFCSVCGLIVDYKMGYGVDENDQSVCKACVEKNIDYAKWGVWEITENEMHIKPTDEPGHIGDGDQCACGPKLEIENGVHIWIHHSFDGREVVDRMIDIVLNYKSNSGK